MGVLSVALSSTLCPATAAAQAADAPAPATGDDARRFFDAAQRAFNEGRYVDAAHGFEQAFKLKPHPAPLINAGDAWDKAGEYALAARAYQSVLSLKEATEQDRIDATDRLTRIAPKLGIIELVGNSKLRARIDDEEFRGGDRVYLFPGEHRVALVDVDGAQVRAIQLAAGTERSVDLATLMPRRGAKPETAPEAPKDTVVTPEPSGGIQPRTFIAYGVGAVGLLGGVFFGLQVNAAEDDYNARPNREDLDAFNQSKLLTNISLGVGLVGVGVGTFFLVQDMKAKGSTPQDSARARRSLPLDLSWTPQGTLLTTSGRW